MKRRILPCLVAALLWLPSFGYNDHRGHNVDSLERVVASWTPEMEDSASEEQLLQLNRACRDLMLAYNVINGEKCVFYARKALSISHPRGWNAADSDAYRYLGLQFYGREQYDSALVYFNRSLECVERMKAGAVSPTAPDGYTQSEIDDFLSSLYGSIGNLYNMKGSIPEAMEWYEKAGALFEKNGWNESNSILYYNIGETWVDEGEYKKAAAAYGRAMDYAEASGDSLMIVDVYKGFGRLYMETGRTWRSLRFLRKADAYYAAHPDFSPSFRTENLDVMKEVLSRQKKQLSWLIGTLLILLSLAVFFIVRRKKPAAVKDTPQAPVAAAPDLSDREKEILDLLSKGYTTPQIAECLSLSPETIKWYRKKLLVKFDVANVAELVLKARDAGILY